MFKQLTLISIIAGASMMMVSNPIFAEDQDKTQDKTQTQLEDMPMVYGSQLMTQQERVQYHQQYFALKTEQEREQFRDLHHQQMQARANEQGVTLPPWSNDMDTNNRGMNGGGMGANNGGMNGAGMGNNRSNAGSKNGPGNSSSGSLSN